MSERPQQAMLIYDGDCPLCRRSKTWIERQALPGMFEYLACQDAARQERFPGITIEACMAAIHLILPDGRVLVGAEALPEILRRLHGWRRLERLARFGPLKRLSRLVYAKVAENRYFLSCSLGSCSK